MPPSRQAAFPLHGRFHPAASPSHSVSEVFNLVPLKSRLQGSIQPLQNSWVSLFAGHQKPFSPVSFAIYITLYKSNIICVSSPVYRQPTSLPLPYFRSRVRGGKRFVPNLHPIFPRKTPPVSLSSLLTFCFDYRQVEWA